ncbi:UDP-glucose dehydrogenase family protein [Paenibacillus thalictri]|uniref:UDP-glucose dehydrogenase family protein n=1 Tax=Paenibacillus thalictri TaxID=2527873 RepID=UPI0013EF046A|nr:UDP-glucose/GDP-mannose dehydrogenase family protein [Paenibacillus thalictri]
MKVAVIGTGYVGLVTGTCLAYSGHSVVCVDSSAEKIAILSSGGLPLWEQGLDELLNETIKLGRICFTTDMKSAVQSSDVLIVCVGTPWGPGGEADLDPLWSVVRQVALYCKQGPFLIIKSTVPVGTSDEIEQWLHTVQTKPSIEVIHNPEFLRQGAAVYDFFHPDRIVAGCRTIQARSVITELYKDIAAHVYFCDRRSSELIKYASNAFLAMKISFINMMADFSEHTGARIDVVAAGMGMDRRIGKSFLQAGIGYGGSCFPKDLQALLSMGHKWNCSLPLLESTVSINAQRPQHLVDKLLHALGTLKAKRIALLGLTFKPMTDDLREATSLAVSRLCLQHGADLHAYDPFVRDYPIAEVVLHRDMYEAIDSADAIVILTEWEQLHDLDWQLVSQKLRTRVVIDGRNMFDWDDMQHVADTCHITYISMGRPVIYASTAMKSPDPV